MYFTKRFNKYMVIDIINLYIVLYHSVNNIAKIYNCDYRSIYNILKNNKVVFRTNSEAQLKRYENIDLDNKILELYNNRYSMRKICKLLPVSRIKCARILCENGIDTKNYDKRIYSVDDSYFRKIDNENKAYWLGFIVADGCVYRNKLIVGVGEKDKCHIEKLKCDLGATYPVRSRITNSSFKIDQYKKSHMSEIRISSKQIISDLKSYGVIQNKTFKTIVPNINSRMYVHFWRGVVDGDGWLGKYDNKCVVGLCGTYNIVDGFAKFISLSLGIKYRKPSPHGSIFKIVYCGTNNPKKIVNLLYRGSNIFLDRKNIIANNINRGVYNG